MANNFSHKFSIVSVLSSQPAELLGIPKLESRRLSNGDLFEVLNAIASKLLVVTNEPPFCHRNDRSSIVESKFLEN